MPMVVNGNVPPRRLTNAARRPREYLTPAEVEQLIAAATARTGRHGHRDATMILIACLPPRPAGVRAASI